MEAVLPDTALQLALNRAEQLSCLSRLWRTDIPLSNVVVTAVPYSVLGGLLSPDPVLGELLYVSTYLMLEQPLSPIL